MFSFCLTTFVLEETRGAAGVGGVSVRVACSVFLFVCRGGGGIF